MAGGSRVARDVLSRALSILRLPTSLAEGGGDRVVLVGSLAGVSSTLVESPLRGLPLPLRLRIMGVRAAVRGFSSSSSICTRFLPFLYETVWYCCSRLFTLPGLRSSNRTSSYAPLNTHFVSLPYTR